MIWRYCTVGNYVDKGEADIQTGPFGTQLKASDYVAEGTPVINVRNIGFGVLKPEKLEYVSEEIAERLSVHLLEPNDIVFGRKGAVERHLFVSFEQEKWMQGSDCIRLRFNSDEVMPNFISYAFRAQAHLKWMIAQSGNKATMASLNHDIIRRIPLRLPPVDVQRSIASILSGYDDLIENNGRRMTLLEEAAQQLYREWFIRLRFPGNEHTRITGGMPEGWERKALGDVITLNYGKALKEDNRIAGATAVFGSSGIVGSHEHALVLGPGIVVGRKGNVGSVFWSDGPFWPIDTVYYVASEVSDFFLYHCLKHMHFQSSDAAVPGLNRNYAHSIKTLIPSKNFRNQFEESVAPMFAQIAKLRTYNEKLRVARDLLLPRLMNGEVAV